MEDVNDLGNTPAAQEQMDALAEQADAFGEGFNTQRFDGEEKIPYQRTQEEQDALAQAVAAFKEDRRNASFSKRNVDLGKMINCPLCGMRHRRHDPILRDSTAHGPQVFGDLKLPSRRVAFAKQRFHPHLKHGKRRLSDTQAQQKLSRRINWGLACS